MGIFRRRDDDVQAAVDRAKREALEKRWQDYAHYENNCPGPGREKSEKPSGSPQAACADANTPRGRRRR
ncbi:hypothetical protein NX801_24455 [Streptomyces sp. LP05-1]|uniref:Uncharacterized protein n=1 Tax=Streptomyces pyxinae TaxID=2970734 RepID=A0ABT2CMV7_9ACTN|nr:hypothetical protein [Streptomyces sp. LP05-1]MCS0638750.1 hypothetical protein [Streptomyces sp. LP05-1]